MITDLSGKVITEAHETFSSYDVNNINSEIVLQLNLLLKKWILRKYSSGIAIPGHFDYDSQTIISNNPLLESV